MARTTRILDALRLVGVTAAVAAGIAGFATVDAAAPAETLVVEAARGGQVPQLPQQACDNAKSHAAAAARPFLSCRVIDGDGPIEGAPIFS